MEGGREGEERVRRRGSENKMERQGRRRIKEEIDGVPGRWRQRNDRGTGQPHLLRTLKK